MFSFQPSPCPTDSDTTADQILDNCSETHDYTVGDDRRDSKRNEKVVLEISTKELTSIRSTSLKQKHDEEEYHLMQGIATSINIMKDRRAQNNAVDAFGVYVSKKLSELSQQTRSMAQYHINNILLQAQMGTLVPSQPQIPHHTFIPPVVSQPQEGLQVFSQQQLIPCARDNCKRPNQPLTYKENSTVQGENTMDYGRSMEKENGLYTYNF